MKKKKSRGPRKDEVSVRERRGSMDHFKYDSSPSVIEDENVQDASENVADVTLRRLVQGKVFRSNPESVKDTNTNKRRYA